MAGGAAALGVGGAPAGNQALTALIGDGPRGILSAGVMARRGDGRLALAQTVGQRITGKVTAPFGLDDPFRVASVSKMITTVGFMRLVEAGKIGLEDDASDALGFRLRHPAFADQPIRIRHLLSHTSALRNGPSYPVPAGHALREAFEASGRNWDGGAWFGPADKSPGAWFCYADVNFCLIAQIIERLTGARFDRYMTAEVLAPLKLDAGYNWSGVSDAKRAQAASAQRWLDGRWTAQTDGDVPAAPTVVYPQPRDGPVVVEADLKLGDNGFLFSPLGGLRLSLRDMDALARMFRAGGVGHGVRVIGWRSLEQMQTAVWRYDPADPNGDRDEGGTGDGVFGAYGLGVEVPKGGLPGSGDGDAFFGAESADWRGHLGDAYGWMTGLFWNRRTGATLVYALNGMTETNRPLGRRSALTPQEEVLIDTGLAALKA